MNPPAVLHSLMTRLLARALSRFSEPTRKGLAAGHLRMRPSMMAIGAWGLVTGIAMAKSGLTLAQALGMSLLVFAGSAQLASLPLIVAGLPIWTVLLTATIVNLRFVIFSAGIQPHFKQLPLMRRMLIGYFNGDLNFLLFIDKYPRVPDGRTPEMEGYFYGLSLSNWLAWQISSIAGILLASQIPAFWGLGFAGTLALLAILVPLMGSRSGAAAALVAAVVAVLAEPLPYKLNLVCAVLAAIAAGLALDELGNRHAAHRAERERVKTDNEEPGRRGEERPE